MSNLITRCQDCKKYEWSEKDYRKESPLEVVEGLNGNVTDGFCPDCLSKRYAFIKFLKL